MLEIGRTIAAAALRAARGAGLIGYDNSVSGSTATNVQGAIDEALGASGAAPASTTERGTVLLSGTPTDPNNPVVAENADARLSDARTPVDASVTDVKVAGAAAIAESKLALASDAAAGTPSRRSLGTGAAQALPGNHASTTDTRTPTDASVTNAKVAAAAAIAETKLALASDAAAGTASRRTLGTGANQAAPGNDARLKTVQDESVPLTNRPLLDFQGSGVAATDDATNGKTVVTISGAAAGAASETAVGITEQATEAEVQAGTAGNLFATVARLKAELDRRFTAPAWIAPTLVNSWVNFGAPDATAGYYKDGNGVVYLKGLIKSGTLGTVAFTLPAGYRPLERRRWAVTSQSNTTPGMVIVDSTGTVVPQAGSSTWISLDGVTFRAEA